LYIKAILGFILLGIQPLHATHHLIVKKVRINNEAHKARLVLDLNHSHSFKVTEEPGLIIITLPSDVEWQSHTSRSFKNGVLKGYTLKNNCLHIRVHSHVHLGASFKLGPLKGSDRFVVDFIADQKSSSSSLEEEPKMRKIKKEPLILAPSSMTWSQKKSQLVSSPLQATQEADNKDVGGIQIKEIRLGVEGDRTRLVLETNSPIQFRADKTLEEVKLYAMSNTKWPSSDALPYAQGAIHKLSLETDGTAHYLDLQIIPGTIIDWEHLDTTNPEHPRYTLDFTVLPPPPNDHNLKPEDRTIRALSPVHNLPSGSSVRHTESVPSSEVSSDLPGVSSEIAALSSEANEGEELNSSSAVSEPLVKKVDIQEDDQGTHLHLHLSTPQDFMVKREGTRVWIELPKMNWSHIETSTHTKGLIENYFIDQADPLKAYLVLNVKDGVVLTGEKIIPATSTTSPQYVLSMQTRDKIGPHWGLGIMPPP